MWRCLGWLVFQKGQYLELLHLKVSSLRWGAFTLYHPSTLFFPQRPGPS